MRPRITTIMSKYTAAIEKLIAQAEEDGFQRGLKYLRDALSAPVPKAKGGSLVRKPLVRVKSKKLKRVEKQPDLPHVGKTVERRVMDCIAANPGKTGAEIIRLLGDVNPRTVRTMLRRLKMKKKIDKSGEGWFTRLD